MKKLLTTGCCAVLLFSLVGTAAHAETVSSEKISSSTVNLQLAEGKFGKPNRKSGMAKAMEEYNADSVGWISIAGTKVNNPLVQCADNDYYLSMGFNHQPYRAGTVFMDYRNVFGFDQNQWSDNLIFYGHNMANNEMFGSLRRYRQDENYHKQYPFIELYSNYEHATYVICALPITYGGADADWRYWDMEEFETEEDFNTYMKYAKEQSVYPVDVDVKYGDKLVTLSTCYSDEDNSRFLVIARKLRAGETAETFSTPKTEETTEATT